MTRYSRPIGACFSLLTATLGLVCLRLAASPGRSVLAGVLLTTAAAAYLVLAALSARHTRRGVVPLDPSNGPGAALWRWLGPSLLLPVWVVGLAGRRFARWQVAREIGTGLEDGEQVRHLLYEEGPPTTWVLTDRALHVGGWEGVFWRVPDGGLTATCLPSARRGCVEVVLTVTGRSGPHEVRGTFTARDAREVQRHVATRTAR